MSVLEQSFGPFKELELKLPEGAKVVDRIHDEIVIEIDEKNKLINNSDLQLNNVDNTRVVKL